MKNTDKSNVGADQTVAAKAKEVAATASEEVRSRAQDVADTVATEAGSYAGEAKNAAASEVKDVASALRTAADEMRSGSPQERTFSQIADGLADASDSLRDKDLGEMVGAVTDFAKRNPMVFLGSAALIGFAATRFAKASGDRGSRTTAYSGAQHQMDRSTTAGLADTTDLRGGQASVTGTSHEGNKL